MQFWQPCWTYLATQSDIKHAYSHKTHIQPPKSYHYINFVQSYVSKNAAIPILATLLDKSGNPVCLKTFKVLPVNYLTAITYIQLSKSFIYVNYVQSYVIKLRKLHFWQPCLSDNFQRTSIRFLCPENIYIDTKIL